MSERIDTLRLEVTLKLSEALAKIEEAFAIALPLSDTTWQGEIDIVRGSYNAIIAAQSYLDPENI